VCTSLSGCTASEFSICTDSCRNANKADSKQDCVDNHCISPSLSLCLSGCTAGKFSVCTDSCRDANKADGKQDCVDNHCISPSLFYKKYLLFFFMSEVYPAQYHRNDTGNKRKLCLTKFFGLAPVTSLQTASVSLNNKGRYQERGNCDDPYTAAYESPFTANYAGPFCVTGTCKDQY
jgi:hypothetical protein